MLFTEVPPADCQNIWLSVNGIVGVLLEVLPDRLFLVELGSIGYLNKLFLLFGPLNDFLRRQSE